MNLGYLVAFYIAENQNTTFYKHFDGKKKM